MSKTLPERPCEHIFEKFRPWPFTNRWRCVRCSLVTRHYDSVDGMATRPIHRHMTVAVKGYNTLTKNKRRRWRRG